MSKYIVSVLLTVHAIPIVTFAIWYELSFQTYTSHFEELSKHGNNEALPVMPELHKYAVTTETEQGIRAYASQLVISF